MIFLSKLPVELKVQYRCYRDRYVAHNIQTSCERSEYLEMEVRTDTDRPSAGKRKFKSKFDLCYECPNSN
jgi:hypothetical protein